MIEDVKPGGRFRRRILLVDSDEALLLGCSDALLAEGFEVITARNGFEALHVLRGSGPDVLVTELNLPHMSGFELLSVVRKAVSIGFGDSYERRVHSHYGSPRSNLQCLCPQERRIFS